MTPAIFPLITASAAAKAQLGTNPTRFYSFGMAPQNVAMPYAVWQTVGGQPENYINQRPDIDRATVQIDVYAATAAAARTAAEAVRDALEGRCHVVAWRGESQDQQTMRFTVGFDVDWWQSR